MTRSSWPPGLAPLVPRVLLGARIEWDREGRHPALLARDVTSLDLVCGGRSVLCFAPPFTEPLAEAISLCRALWLAGEAVHEGPHFPVQAAANRARPAGEEIPQIALDLTAGDEVPSFLVGAADLLLWPLAQTPAALPPGERVTDTTVARHEPETASATTAVTGRHLPALNGLRGLAVIGVVAYHLQLGWAQGGYLGVDLFFVLSGFLITTLLLEEWVGAGRINLVAFWGRRARRLLPALFLVVAALALYLICNARFGGPGANGLIDLSGLRGDAIATLLYVNNWHLIFAHQSYFAQFSTPSPLQHTWSLAIEEQFYLVWPPLLLVLLRYGRRGWRRVGVTVTVALGVGLLGADGGAVPPRGGPLAHLLRDRYAPVRPHGRGDHRVPGGGAAPAKGAGASYPPPGRPRGGRRPRGVLGARRHARRPADRFHVRGRLPALRRARRAGRSGRPPH